jgi:hypothetical protein
MLRQICEQILVIEQGRLVTVAPPGQAIRVFHDILINTGLEPPEPSDADAHRLEPAVPRRHAVELTRVTPSFPGQDEHAYIESGDAFTLTVEFQVNERIEDVSFGIAIVTERGDVVFSEVRHAIYGGGVFATGAGQISFVFDRMPLLDGRLIVNVDVRDSKGLVIDVLEPACDIEVMYPGQASGMVMMPFHFDLRAPGEPGHSLS